MARPAAQSNAILHKAMHKRCTKRCLSTQSNAILPTKATHKAVSCAASPAAQREGLLAVHRKDYQGREITVNIAKPRDASQRGGGGGGGGGGGPPRGGGGDRYGGGGGGGDRGGDRYGGRSV